NADAHKVKFAEREFYALKKRCSGQEGNSLKCFCLVAVKKEDKNIRRTVLKSIVGTLDLSIRQYFSGETYPGEIKRSTALFAAPKPFDAHKYAYISNVVVSKYARRQGIATNMIHLAADVASFTGMKMLFVHVNADNTPAQDLYRKCGLKFSFSASPQPSKDDKLLMYMEL
uniref:N-acetyltransferase domain-containing protein n=1 Tax=Kalanchoe fedtschenkoi TaxID=63787 RepID=A0A7N1A2H2_KALFE